MHAAKATELTAWLVACPLMLDASFPRSVDELDVAREAVLELDELVSGPNYELVLTPELAVLSTLVEWGGAGAGELYDLQRLMRDQILSPAGRTVIVDFKVPSGAVDYAEAPCALGRGFGDEWRVEVGRLGTICAQAGVSEPFVGVACARSLAGEPMCVFPAVSPPADTVMACGANDLDQLGSAYEPVYDPAVVRSRVPLSTIDAHWAKLGALGIRDADGSSHLKVLEFAGRSWPYDINDDPIPHNNLRTLARCTGLPRNWVKTILLTGDGPELRPIVSRSPDFLSIR